MCSPLNAYSALHPRPCSWLKRLRAEQGHAATSISLLINKADRLGAFAYDGGAEVDGALAADFEGAAAAADAAGASSDVGLSTTAAAEEAARAALEAAARGAEDADAAGADASSGGVSLKGQSRWRTLEHECYALGLGAPIAVSAESRMGFSDLHNALFDVAAAKAAAAATSKAAAAAARRAAAEARGAATASAAAGARVGVTAPAFVAAAAGGDAHAAGAPAAAAATDADIEAATEAPPPVQDDAYEPAVVEVGADDIADADAASSGADARFNGSAAAASAREGKAALPIHMAIVGRPNVGKSSVVNQLLGHDRVLTGPQAGLTRDPTTVTLQHRDARIQMVDTAGMRRWGAWDLTTPLEGEAVGAARRALQRANVVVLVVDASGGTKEGLTLASQALSVGGGSGSPAASSPLYTSTRGRGAAPSMFGAPSAGAAASSGVRSSRELPGAGLTRQDMSIAEQVIEEGRGLVVVLNKVDTLAPHFAAAAARAAAAAAAGGASGPSQTASGLTADSLSGGGQMAAINSGSGTGAATVPFFPPADPSSSDEEEEAVVGLLGAGADRGSSAAAGSAGAGSGAGAGVGGEGSAVSPAVRAAHRQLLQHPNVKRVIEFVRTQLDSMQQCGGAEIVPVSALTGAGREKILPAVLRTYQRWNLRVPTSTLNRWLELIQRHHPPPADTVTVSSARPDREGKRPTRRIPLKLKFLSQTAVRPPTFTLFVNRNAGAFPRSCAAVCSGLRFLVPWLRR